MVYWELLTLARASPYGNTDLQGIFAFLKAGKRLSCNPSVKQYGWFFDIFCLAYFLFLYGLLERGGLETAACSDF